MDGEKKGFWRDHAAGRLLGAIGIAVVGYIASGRGIARPPFAPTTPAVETPDVPTPAVPLRLGWSRPQPAVVSRPTYWPVVLALGITFIAWGFATNYVVSFVGLLLFCVATVGWIADLVMESEQSHGNDLQPPA